ncbi:malate synthase A [Actinokineospora sp.]|uniref:malate synthase A n=1 Tax=Actinokineospora sp. TaxID=1872133 RepID=UPI003D6AD979
MTMPTVQAEAGPDQEQILTPDALTFLADLQRTFGPRRDELLAARRQRRAEIGRTGTLDLRPETADVRAAEWQVAPAPRPLQNRRVEITGPTDPKMAINALNSGAKIWLADLEDANTPHWHNVIEGQLTLYAAHRRALTYTSPEGKAYQLSDGDLAVPLVRPRGWHLDEKHVLVDDRPMSGSLFDFGLHFFHNAHELLARGQGPYYYLAKLESHLEARLWNDVFIHAQDALGIPRGSVRATVLIETIPAAFEMDEILYELREHASGLNAGRWDYLFSVIKYFRDVGPDFVLPDRNGVGMASPFMRAYTDLLVRTCHRRGAVAMGGMSAFIPSRRDPELTEVALAKVRADKEREARDGFDGSWVAHPDLVPVCREVFDGVLGERPNQLDRTRDEVSVTADQLLDVSSTPGEPTSEGLRGNVAVALRYLEAWLRGSGAVAIFNLMEDAATAEIARSQIWQWLRNDVKLADSGELVTADLVRRMEDEELATIRESLGAEQFEAGRFGDARALFERVALSDDFVEFLTLPAYDLID